MNAQPVERPANLTFLDSCRRCSLAYHRTNIVRGEGDVNRARIIVLGEAPGRDEDRLGRPFIGRSGMVLRGIVKAAGEERGIPLLDLIWITNTYKCRPPNNDISHARGSPCPDLWFRLEYEKIQPRLIVALGKTAFNYLFPSLDFGMIRGKFTGHREFGPVFVTWHPAYVLRRRDALEEFREDWRRVAAVIMSTVHP
jgi:uracil-DNA glycosylase family 4